MAGRSECRAGGMWEGLADFLGSCKCAANPQDSLSSQQLMRGLLGKELGMHCLQHGCFHCLSRALDSKRRVFATTAVCWSRTGVW